MGNTSSATPIASALFGAMQEAVAVHVLVFTFDQTYPIGICSCILGVALGTALHS